MNQGADGDVDKAIRAQLKQHLHDRVKQYREQQKTVAAYLQRDPKNPIRERRANREAVATQLQTLREMWRDVLPYIRHIKTLVPDVLEPSRVCACYLLFGKFANGLEAILVLAKHGFHYEVIEIVRSNREALDLIHFFLRERNDSASLRKWFDGDIIKNARARASLDYVAGSLPVSKMKAGIYGGLSSYSHVSYAALLESYDVHHHDFDFGRFAGYHWVLSSLRYVRTEIHSAIITLKAFYGFVVQDRESYLALDTLLRKYAPEMYDDEARRVRNADIEARFKKR